MKKRLLTICVIFLSLFIFLSLSCEKKPSPDTLIKIGSNEIGKARFFEYFPLERFLNLSEAQKKNKVNDFLTNQLILHDAYKSGFSRRKNVAKKVNFEKNSLLFRNYLDRTILDSIITDEIVLDLFSKSFIEIKASHILISTQGPKAQPGISKNQALKKALEVYNLAVSGEPFDKLSKKYSDDKASSETGDLGYFRWGRMVPEFQEAAFSMKVGEISKPVMTKYGYHIIKVTDRKDLERPPFNQEMKDKIKNSATRQYNQQLRNAYMKFVENLKLTHEFNKHKQEIDRFISLYKQHQEKIKNEKRQRVNPLTVLESIPLNETLLSYKGGKIDTKTITKKIEINPRIAPPNLSDRRYFESFLENLAISNIIANKAKEMNLDKTEKFISALNDFQNKIMVNEYKEVVIQDKIKTNEDELRKFYEDNNESLYMQDETAEVQEIFIKDKAKAKKILKEALGGSDFSILADDNTERSSKKNKSGNLGFITKKQYGKIGKIALETEPGTIHNQLVPWGKGFSIIKVLDKRPPSPKEFDSIQPKLKSDYKRNMQNKLESENLSKLKRKYKPKIYWDVVNLTE